MGSVHQDNEKPGTSKGWIPLTATTTVTTAALSSKTSAPADLDLIDVEDDEELETYIYENLDRYLSRSTRAAQCDFLTAEEYQDFRTYEVKERECLRELRIQTELAKAETTRIFESNILSLPVDLFDMRLRKLIQDTDNPPTFDELLRRLVQDHDDEELDTDEEEGMESWESAETEGGEGHESVPGGSKSIPQSEEDGAMWEDHGEEEEFQEIPATPERSKAHTTRSSEEIFQTPVSHMVGEEHTKSRVGAKALQFPIHPIPASKPIGGKFQHVPPPPVFQFQGNPTKEPRLLKPGEIIFSATGSPIAIAPLNQGPPSQVSSSGTNQPDSTDQVGQTGMVAGTPLLNGRGKPARIRVDNPNGPPMQIELVCLGGGGAGDEHFRNLVTDFRGFMTTRSMMQNKLMAPRVPNSGAKGPGTSKKRVYTSSVDRKGKPMWRN